MVTPYNPPVEPGTFPLRGVNNQLLTISLFYERWIDQSPQYQAEGLHPVFSLWEKDGYISARLTFLAERDPTGVKWAEKWLAGVTHLNRLLQANWFMEAFEVWVQEVEQLVQAEALAKIRAISTSQSPAAFQAAKYLAGQEWKKNSRGRPSKAAIAAEVKRSADAMTGIDDDLLRITGRASLKVVK